MQIKTTGKQMELTDAISSYVDKKINSLDKYFEGVMKASVVVGCETHHHLKGDIFFAECKIEVPGNNIFAKNTAKDVYAAIDLLRDELTAEIKKHKTRMRGNEKKKKTVARSVKEYQADSEEEV
jgi:putative sigma-54 modulation protein